MNKKEIVNKNMINKHIKEDIETFLKVTELCEFRLKNNKSICIINALDNDFKRMIKTLFIGIIIFLILNPLLYKGRLNIAIFSMSIVVTSLFMSLFKASILIKKHNIILKAILSDLRAMNKSVLENGFDNKTKNDFTIIEKLIKEQLD